MHSASFAHRTGLLASLGWALWLSGCGEVQTAQPPSRAASQPSVEASAPSQRRAPVETVEVPLQDFVPAEDQVAEPTAKPAPSDPADIRPSFQRPDLVFIQDLQFDAENPNPSLQRLAALSSWGGAEVVFYEELHPDSSRLRVQGHRMPSADPDSTELVLHGPEWRWYANGQIQLRRIYEHGKVSGEFVDWFENGFMRSRGELVADRFEGEWIRWARKGGRLREVATWREGLNDGLQYSLWPRGELKSITPWSAGKKQGVERVWQPDGQLQLVRTWKDGVDHGPRRDWNEAGILVRAANYEQGRLHGSYSEWYDSGALRLRGEFERKQRVGTWEAWTADGTRTSIEHYEQDLLHGAKQLWSPEGVLLFEGEFVRGAPDGVHREFYLGGGPKSVAHYSGGLHNGSSVAWHATGGKQSEGELVDGQRHGRWTVWNKDGELLKAYGGLYEHGERVSD